MPRSQLLFSFTPALSSWGQGSGGSDSPASNSGWVWGAAHLPDEVTLVSTSFPLAFLSSLALDAVPFLSFLPLDAFASLFFCTCTLPHSEPGGILLCPLPKRCPGGAEITGALPMENSRAQGSTQDAEMCSRVLGSPASPVTLGRSG